METKQVSLDKLEDLADGNPELQKFLEGHGGIPALRKHNKPSKYLRVSTRQQRAILGCK